MTRLRQIISHSGRRIMALADNARFHHASLHAVWRNDCAGRFSLLFLPPYSPELNPIERGWKLARRLATHNRYLAHVDEVAHAVESIFKNG